MPIRLNIRKYEKLCRGISASIQLEEGRKWISRIGREKARRESYVMLEVINSIEEDEKSMEETLGLILKEIC